MLGFISKIEKTLNSLHSDGIIMFQFLAHKSLCQKLMMMKTLLDKMSDDAMEEIEIKMVSSYETARIRKFNDKDRSPDETAMPKMESHLRKKSVKRKKHEKNGSKRKRIWPIEDSNSKAVGSKRQPRDDLIKNKEQTQNTVKSNTDRNKVIIEDWVDSDDEEIPLGFSEIKKQNVLKSETSSENKSPRSKDSFGKESRRRGLGYRDGSRDSRSVWNNTSRVNHRNFSSDFRHPHQRRSFIPSAVLTREGLKSTVRSKMSQAVPSQSTASTFYQNTAKLNVSKAVLSQVLLGRYFSRQCLGTSTGRLITKKRIIPKSPKPIIKSKWVKKESTAGTQAVLPQTKGEKGSVMTSPTQTWRPKGAYLDHRHKNNGSYTLKKFEYGNPEEELKDHAIIDSGCSRSMTGDKDKLSDFKDYKGGYVAFGNDPKGGRITGKGTIKTSCIDFENVSYVKELKFNLLSVSQICDKKHNVLFTDTECLILSPEFKIVDENLVLLRAPRKNDKLGHAELVIKNINKLVKSNLVRGLPSKTFKHDHSCLACRKGKQHKASCKKLEERTVREPLELLHMDLFGPVSVASLNRKKYCLVVTDDCSLRNKLKTKSETIRCAPINGTEFKNKLMNEFCAKKGIQREYSIARTPQQNGVAERKNRTLIEAARTMLADSLLPIQFWAEAVHTACYVLNRVLVTKPQMKTPYELLMGKSPNISFMKPFGCPLTILNTLDHLSKFEGKSEEGYLLGYSTNSKGFRVYNKKENTSIAILKVGFEANARRDCFIQSYKSVVGEFDLPDVNDLLELNGSIRNKRDERVSKDTAGIFISQDKYVKGFLTNLTSNNLSQHTTPIEAHKARGKKMKKARFKSTPEKLPTHVEKRLFRYLKHQPKLVYGNPKDLPYSLRMPFHDSGLCWDNHDRRSLLVHTDDNMADLLTKGFDLARFNSFGGQYWNDEPIATFKGRNACKVWTLVGFEEMLSEIRRFCYFI
ncbi:putative ribonuclease H-like domain-containing protein [Tanacetum coccineum]